MRTLALAALLACAAGAKETPMTYEAPSGWAREKKTVGADTLVVFSKPPHRIAIRRLGGKASRHESPAAFLASFEAKSEGGRPPEKAGSARVMGSSAAVWRRSWRKAAGSPHENAPPSAGLATEEFVVVPAGARFYVLSWTVNGPSPASDKDPGRAAWRTLLSTFKG